MPTFFKRNRWWLLVFVAAIGVALDQGTKHLAKVHLSEEYFVKQPFDIGDKTIAVIEKHHRPIDAVEAVPNFLNFIYKENAAAAFSLTESWPGHVRKPFLIILSFLAIIFFLVWFLRAAQDFFLLLPLAFIIAGAIGNFYDRVVLGFVIDFIDVYAGIVGMPNLHFATFNIADSFICLGAFAILMRSSFADNAKKEAIAGSNGHIEERF